jgi:regulatory protein
LPQKRLQKSLPTETPILKGSDKTAAPDAYLKALDLLARRDHSRGELRKKLVLRGCGEKVLEEVLERLSSQGLINDAKFAAGWVQSALRSGRGFGAKLLADLQQKGVSRETAREAVAAAAAENPAELVLAAIVQRRFAAFNNETATQKERQRVYAYLQRRGFSFSSISSYFRNQDTGCDR